MQKQAVVEFALQPGWQEKYGGPRSIYEYGMTGLDLFLLKSHVTDNSQLYDLSALHRMLSKSPSRCLSSLTSTALYLIPTDRYSYILHTYNGRSNQEGLLRQARPGKSGALPDPSNSS